MSRSLQARTVSSCEIEPIRGGFRSHICKNCPDFSSNCRKSRSNLSKPCHVQRRRRHTCDRQLPTRPATLCLCDAIAFHPTMDASNQRLKEKASGLGILQSRRGMTTTYSHHGTVW
ncbi:hypothetical protein H310_09504 [Aphanomyces invadans]|uniref:Uncharacterized protein n=1 Tax=Aphanomyces invadans TaxID=157072 RepID=A0A024TUA5_9STRA|nr:hypothetical protein H310_09504 [Aphanomyces invadans]ETV97608.1 hypothetical protein H310_09504 [Aphanomyces invadans]|eukprot:XP_008873817.1 hypothetical protein H310_09504 [Aphanomyces invadans]